MELTAAIIIVYVEMLHHLWITKTCMMTTVVMLER